jgi:hypothetical protein
VKSISCKKLWRKSSAWLHDFIKEGKSVRKLICFVLLVALPGFATAWSIKTEPYPAGSIQPTHCGFYFDAAPKVRIAATTDETGKFCVIDLATVTLTNGSHTVKATFIIDHPVIPAESDFSNSLTFTWPIPVVPGKPSAPSTLQLVP